MKSVRPLAGRFSYRKKIVCGDFNTAHKEIDLARPKDNHHISGFLKEKRDWMDRYQKAVHLDTFRIYNQGTDKYTWWHMMTNARARNVGWRIDYFFIHKALENIAQDATIEAAVMGSAHCPVTLTLRV
ncbi:MAG: endonuclease/exonuclease/phosphatase family protein [Candidatus Melainabacteria bacterium]|nr:endonuclease/exonuclease/phosphatase family protein [Candidatus Melainabacteria bacterium]